MKKKTSKSSSSKSKTITIEGRKTKGIAAVNGLKLDQSTETLPIALTETCPIVITITINLKKIDREAFSEQINKAIKDGLIKV